MEQYINQIYNEPYNLFCNNCIHKSLKIFKKAKELRIKAELVLCIAKNPKLWGWLTIIYPHVYVLVNGQRVDVALCPEQEKKYWENSGVTIYLPIRLIGSS